MKILEAQSATLTNYEVYSHLIALEKKHDALKKAHPHDSPLGKRPGSLNTIVLELLQYFRDAPSPLASQPFPYNEHTIKNLLEGLRPWDFTKGEIIMILNLRPTKPENLNTIIEEMEERFPGEEVQQQILSVIAEVLGRPDGEAERQAMTDNAKVARKEQLDQEATQEDGMHLDG